MRLSPQLITSTGNATVKDALDQYKSVKPDCNSILENNQQALQSDYVCEDSRLITDYGAQYNGCINEGEMNGKGSISYPNGIIETGSFSRNNFVYGTRRYPSGGIDQGVFVNRKLNACGKRWYPDGRNLTGLFEDDELVFGRINYPKVIEDGVRYIDGEITFFLLNGYGEKSFANHDFQIGEFESNRLKEGWISIAGKPYKWASKNNWYFKQDGSYSEYFLNGQKIVVGEFLGSSECFDIFVDSNTPFLFNQPQAKLADSYFNNKQLSQIVFKQFQHSSVEMISNGRDLMLGIFNKELETSHDYFNHENLDRLFNQIAGYNYDQKMAIFFNLVDLIDYTDQDVYAELNSLISNVKNSNTVWSGLRAMSRFEELAESISQLQTLLLKAVLFYSLGEVLKDHPGLSYIDCSFQLKYPFENEQYIGFFVTTNLDQFNAMWSALTDGRHDPPKPVDVMQFDLELLNGMSYRIPNSMINEFRKRIAFNVLQIGKAIYFKVPRNLAESKVDSLKQWQACVYETLHAAELKTQDGGFSYLNQLLLIGLITFVVFQFYKCR